MSYLSDFEHTKLEAHVFPGMVVQTHYISDPTTGQRRVPQTQIWKVERLLGKGGFGEVRLEAHAEEQRAVKRIWATGTTFKVEYKRELKALLEFSKPKYKESAVFVGFLGWFQDTESVYLAMEYVPMGDLEDNVKTQGGMIEEVGVKDIAMQILEGLKIMHLERFVHRDLKPKNVLVCRGPPHWWVKLADFGLSKRRTEDTALRTQTGTQAYMAPEILNYISGHSEYTLISGVVPFPPGLSLANFCGDEKRFPSKAFEMSDTGTEFVRRLIVAHPTKRLTAGEALDHAWIKTDPLTSDASLGHLIVPEVAEIDASASFGAYDTVTHAGLQSYGTQNSTVTVKSPTTAAKPVNNYHPPTVEDAYEVDDKTDVASNLSGYIAGDVQDIQPDINTQSSRQQDPGYGPGTYKTSPSRQAEARVEKPSDSPEADPHVVKKAKELKQAERAPTRSPAEDRRKARDKDRRRGTEAKHSRSYVEEGSSSGEERKTQLKLDADRNTPERVSSKNWDSRPYERAKPPKERSRQSQAWVEDVSSDEAQLEYEREMKRRLEREIRRRNRADNAATARPSQQPMVPKPAGHIDFAAAYLQAARRKSQQQPTAKGESSNTPPTNPPTIRRAETFSANPDYKKAPMNERWSEHQDLAAEYMAAARRKVAREEETKDTNTPLRNPPTMRRAETFSANPNYKKAPMNERWSEHRDFAGKYMAAARLKIAREEELQNTISPVASATSGNVRYRHASDLPRNSDGDGYLQPSTFAAADQRDLPRQPGMSRAETFSPPQIPAYRCSSPETSDDEYEYVDHLVDGIVYRRYIRRRPHHQIPISSDVQNDERAPQRVPLPTTRKEYATSEGTRKVESYLENLLPPEKSQDLPRRSGNAPKRQSPPASRPNLAIYERGNRPYSDYMSQFPIDDDDAPRRSSARKDRSPSFPTDDEDMPRRSSARKDRSPSIPIDDEDVPRRSSTKASRATATVPGLPKVRTRDSERRSSPPRNENKEKSSLPNPFQIFSKGKSKKSSSSDKMTTRRRRKSKE
ncbi:hypothetical protein IFR05_009830 [Cadophora sp. M221]|nr:hypothetical protein IFR05_009830 [Cadophora sp. M221]